MLLRLLNPYTFAAPGAIWENAGSGKFVKLISATAAVDVELWQRGAQIGELKGLTQGQGARVEDDDGRPLRFDQCKITSTAAQVVTLGIGDGRIETDALTGTVSASIVQPQTLTDAADILLPAAATTLILAADPTRHSALITNLAANTKTFRVGGATAAAARGAELPPGKSIGIEGGGALYGYNPAGAAESVAVLTVST